MLQKIKHADLYRKVSSDLSHQTVAGGVFSLVSYSIICLLFLSELYCYLYSPYKPTLLVESSLTNRIQVDIGITFPSIPCALLSIMYADISSEYYTKALLHKYPIENGVILYDAHIAHTEPLTPKGCGSCYGAELYEGQCCNTCEEVMEAYTSRNWKAPNPEEVDQCKHKSSEDTFQGEGCLVNGEILTRKIPATIRFELNNFGKAIMSQIPLQFNGDHTINHLGFSDPEGIKVPGPLNGRQVQDNYINLYYLKVNPAEKDDERFYETSESYLGFNTLTYPIIALSYDIEPITTIYKPERTFVEFIVSICAIIGGWHALSIIISKIVIR
ncbi:hypothetical protein SteCoe_33890 [Stentor coeruleus]|uniref:Endoplasmic reticulum vesicle transporter C-terminal domain-containing protein n=1 Tax=Stentor coeruleus TaxID=5963 RepID=A0A1R2AVR8_9CILI|nr:hypothetical protein SteCoe_33890 [Stentor coeruleus]